MTQARTGYWAGSPELAPQTGGMATGPSPDAFGSAGSKQVPQWAISVTKWALRPAGPTGTWMRPVSIMTWATATSCARKSWTQEYISATVARPSLLAWAVTR